jgi:hypothetical protein
VAAPQNVYDAIKRVREEGEAWVTWHGERLRLEPVPENNDQFTGIVRSPRSHGGIALAWVDGYKDGLRVYEGGKGQPGLGFPRRAQWKDILVIVAERHPRPKESS